MAGRLTRPPAATATPDEPAGARKTALEVAAGILVTDASGPEPVVAGHGDVEAIRFEHAEADAFNHLLEHPELHYGSTAARNRARYELRKKASGEAEAASDGGPSLAAGSPPPATPTGEEAGLSTLAKRLADDPATEAKFREAINELDAAAIEKAAIENLYGDDEVDSWDWESVAEDSPETGEQS